MEEININSNIFPIKIDCKNCISMIADVACLDNSIYDCWRFSDQQFESGKIYGLVSEYQQGCMYLSYLLGGKINFGDLKIYGNGIELSRNDLACNSWNLEPSKEYYKKAKVKKSIENALKESNKEENFKDIADICIDLNSQYQYDINRLKQLYQNYTNDNWIH